MKKKHTVPLTLLLIIALGYLISRYYHEATFHILGYGTIEAREVHVGSRLGGRVAKVHKKEGSLVETGVVLIELDDREFKAQEAEALAALKSAGASLDELLKGYRPELIEKAEAQVKEQVEYLKKLKAGPLPEEIQAQEARMKSVEADYQHSQKTYERLVKQVEQGVLPEQERDNAQRSMEMARERYFAEKKGYELIKAGTRIEDIEIAAARLAQAHAELKRFKAGPRKEEVERGKAMIDEIEARLQRIRVQLEECYIRTPTTGQIEVCDLEPGDILPPGRTAVTLLKPQDLWVKVYIKEHSLDRVRVGQKVEVVAEVSRRPTFRSVALRMLFSLFTPPTETKTLPGEIVHIASQAEFTPRNVQTQEERGNQVFAVKVEIKAPQNLRPGMSVRVQEEQPRNEEQPRHD